MKFLFFNEFVPGILRDGEIFDISSLFSQDAHHPQELVEEFIGRYDEIAAKIEPLIKSSKGIAVNSVRLRAPVPRPIHIVCALRNYKEGTELPNVDFFLKSSTCVIGPGDTVVLPDIKASVFHHEPELAVVIKKYAEKVPASKAMDYVFGYTAFNDISARDIGASYYYRKSFDTFGPMGPCMVTADEIPDPHNIRVRLWVDDSERHDYCTCDMANRIDRLIEAASAVTALYPGDIISTGTHHIGLGPVQDGNLCSMEIEHIGVLSVNISDPSKRAWDNNTDVGKIKPNKK
jgi:2-keto-4-pentenoate hydratase/2-oxohepta-3-ene-1,7-dioic acid hydratase in catechol pathway